VTATPGRRETQPCAKALAKSLRRSLTEAERKLWWGLRHRGVEGFRFRRQHPIGPCVADFCCLEARLVVEVDGSQHADTQRAHDEHRTQWLESQGFKVMRFWNWEVVDDPRYVCGFVLDALNERVSEKSKP
jgi:very-short-patch-repair endonuclease